MKPWQRKEKEDANDFGGRKTPRSGGFWGFPGDIKTDKFLIDSKTTKHKSFTIPASMWRKINHEALKSRLIAMLSISLINEDIDLVVLDKNDFIELLK